MNIALIPARGGSKRIPRKNMIDFCGLPLFLWSVRQAKNAKLVDRVVVSTDDDEIAACAVESGADVVRRENVYDTQTLEEVVFHFLQEYQHTLKDNIIVLQPTSPLRMPEDIDACASKILMSVNKEEDLYLWKKIIGNDRVPVNFDLIPRRHVSCNFYRENGSIYVFPISKFMLTASRYGNTQFYPMQKWQSFEIDKPEDIEIVEYFMKTKILKGAV